VKELTGSTTGRAFLALLGALLVATALTVSMALRDRQRVTLETQLGDTADQVSTLVRMFDRAGPAHRPTIVRSARLFGVELDDDDPIGNGGDDATPLVRLLKVRLKGDRRISVLGQTACPPQQSNSDIPAFARHDACDTVQLTFNDGLPLKLTIYSSNQRVTSLPLQRQAGYVTVFIGLILLIAYLIARMAAYPMHLLTAAAASLGIDGDAPELAVTGSIEARRAAVAFNAMRARMRRQIQHRTHMLGAITHDLQTPLTRLRLRLEKVGDAALRAKLISDLATMQTLVTDGLDLASSMDSSEPRHLLDADSLLDSICTDALDGGLDVQLEGHTAAFIMVQAHALRRCLTNVIDNAVKYGHYARIRATAEHGKLVIRIRDGGPGIADMHLDAVLEPFFRLESSRSRDTGGTGIGLTIARNIAKSNEGSLVLNNHRDGGLVVQIELPIIQYRAAITPASRSA
jgi:signal transduction histidine kinase